MKKEMADGLKQRLAADHEYEDAIELIGEEQTERALEILDTISAIFETDISSWCLDHEHDLIDTEEKTLCRVFWFSKGMTDTYIAIDHNLMLKAYETSIPKTLLSDVLMVLDEVIG